METVEDIEKPTMGERLSAAKERMRNRFGDKQETA